MSKGFRFVLILLVLLVGGLFIYPTFKWYFLISPKEKALVNRSRPAIQNAVTKQALEDIRGLLALNKKAPLPSRYRYMIRDAEKNYKQEKRPLPKPWIVQSVLEAYESRPEFFESVSDHYREQIEKLKKTKDWIIQFGLDLSGGQSVVLQANMKNLEQRLGHPPSDAEKEDAMGAALEVLNNRADKFSLVEPQIRRQGNDQILLEIPGEADPERVQAFLQGKGTLNFQILDENLGRIVRAYARQNPQDSFVNGRPLQKDLIPTGFSVRGFYKKNRYGVDVLDRYVVLRDEIAIPGKYIKAAGVSANNLGKPVVDFRLTTEGGEVAYKVSSDNKGKLMGVVMDDKVKAIARISGAFRDSAMVTGFQYAEAQNLKKVLTTAVLPVNLEIISQEIIGASLGRESIILGFRAIVIGFFAVMLFLLFYYRGAGGIAVIALLFNLFLSMGILSAFNITLTLTGIAGIILNIGMAVDANVIIFERIKEEFAAGKSRAASIDAGFKKAFWTIMDSNITTLIASLFLSQLGRGPVKGFAITLSIGILCSLFSAIFVSRLIFDFFTETMKKRTLSIGLKIPPQATHTKEPVHG